MKRILSFCAFVCYHFVLQAQAPTTPASNVTFNLIEGNTYRINWTPGNGARRIVVMRQGAAVTAAPSNGVDYNHNAIFGSGDAILPNQFVIGDNASTFVDVSGLQPGTIYHIAIFEYNGTASTTQYLAAPFAAASQSTLNAPTIQASAIVASNVVGSSMTLTWTNGNGARRLVLMRAGSAVNANPTDLTTYSAGTVFGSGTQIGTGNYVVFASTGNNVTVTGLQPATVYHYAVFEYNGSSGPVYLVPGVTGNTTTIARPTVAASSMTFNILEGNTFRANWINGNGSRRIVVARAGSAVTATPVDGIDYNTSSTFGSGDDLGGNQYVVFDGASTFVDLSNLAVNTTYHFRIYEYDGSGATTAYLTSSFATGSQSTLAAPTMQVSAINFTNLSGGGVTVNWTNGNGARRLVVMRAGSAVNANPTDLTVYSAGPTFGSGSQIGTGNFVVHASTGNNAAVTGLTINTTYHVAVFEYNGSSGPVYLVPGSTASFTTPANPTVPASGVFFNIIDGGSMRMNWVNGNGQRRIVVIRAGSAVTATPTDGIDYNFSNVFGSGDDLGGNQYVISDGVNTFVDVSNLQGSTVYHFRIYEYNGTGVNTVYLTSLFASGSQSTSIAPTTQASAVNFTNIGGSTARINWTNGNGAGRIVLVRAGSAVNANPVDLNAYAANTIFGSGAEAGAGNFVVFRATSGTNITITGLVPNTTYHVAVHEYNGSSGPVYLNPGATGSFTTAAQPTVAATAMSFNIIEGNTLRVNWTNGNGQRRIVVGRAGSAVTAVPANGVDYTPNAVFGNGDAILPGQFVVVDGTSSFVDLSNLTPNTVYHFTIFEYDGTGTNTAYLTSSVLSGSQSTVSAPTIQASNIIFSSVAANSVTTGWTIGNGSNRLVVARQGRAVNADPVNLVTYSGSSTFGSGTQVGTGNYTVHSSSGTSVNVTNLLSGTTYHFSVYEYNGSSGRVYLLPGTTGSVTTLGPPQVQATNVIASVITTTTLQLTWISGSGNRRLVLMRQGAAVNAAPVDNGAYTANTFFGSGTQVGTGNYVVFNAVGNNVLVTGLTPNTSYHFAVYEFNSFGATSQFLLTNPAIGNATTSSALPLTWLSFSGKNKKNRIELQWKTASEHNTSHFEVQRDATGDARNFMSIGIVPATGNGSGSSYSFTDNAPLAGLNYYRIKQYDLDNRFSYSAIVAVKYQPEGLIKRFLNPLHDGLFVELTSFDPNMRSKNEWVLYNMNGVVMARDIITSSVIYGSVPFMPAGVYLLEIRANEKKETIRIVKQ